MYEENDSENFQYEYEIYQTKLKQQKRRKILKLLLVLILVTALTAWLIQPGMFSLLWNQSDVVVNEPVDSDSTEDVTTTSDSIGDDEKDPLYLLAREVFDLTNEERAKQDLSEFIWNDKLYEAAQIRADELNILYSHTRPDGSDGIFILRDMGIYFNYVGENIAIGYLAPEDIVKAWMGSEGHRENIENRNFRYLAVGVARITETEKFHPDSYTWVQLFYGIV